MGYFYDKVSKYKNLFSGWNRVKGNHGCAEVDGVTIEGFENRLNQNLISLQKNLRKKIYKPLPLLKFLVDKCSREARSLSVPTVRDRVAQSATLEVIEPIFEAEFEKISFAYRKGSQLGKLFTKLRNTVIKDISG